MPRRVREWPRPSPWTGFDCDTTCNLCWIWSPSERSDERLLSMETFGEFAFTASLYRTREQGRVLVKEWVRRHGGELDLLLHKARLEFLPWREQRET
jgi:hypothetical protein